MVGRLRPGKIENEHKKVLQGLRVGETRVIEGQRFDRSSDSRIVLDWKSEMLVRRTEATGNGVDIKAISQHQLSPFQTVGSEVEWSGQ
ncbi:hypothetical protein HZH66_014894 [Vespula vulgaris]|uniref:Uncharacterized protein n=1 Tax=Vespula vulgaris TaxID=7454 RepID=A0A834J006_VESVU|nr:hypothetical protein HZH66_014894 [Vespula vulgaris]